MHTIEQLYLSRIQALLEQEHGNAAAAFRNELFQLNSGDAVINAQTIDTLLVKVAGQYGIEWATSDWLQSLLQDCENRHCHHMSGTMTS